MKPNQVSNTLHMYVLCPKHINGEDKQEITRVILKLIDKVGYSSHYCKFNYNEEDSETGTLLEEIKAKHFQDIRIIPFTANFKRHGKKGFAKRNREALLRSTHILMFIDGGMTKSQLVISKSIDNLDKHVYYRNINLGAKHVEKGQESIPPDRGDDVKEN